MSRKIEITTRMGCRVNCRFCPQKLALERYYAEDKKRETVLSFARFKEFMDKIPKDVDILFSGMCEPWLNPECTDMVEYAAKGGWNVDLYITLVGMSMDDFRRVQELPIHQLVLHVADKDGNALIPVTEEYKELLKAVAEGHKEKRPCISSISVHGEIHPDIADIIKEIPDVPVLAEIYDRAGNLEEEDGVTIHVEEPKKGSLACSKCNGYELDDNYLLPDGSLTICPMDWGLEYIIGNLGEQSYEEIAEGAAKQAFRKRMKDPSDTTLLCRRCHVSQPEKQWRREKTLQGMKQKLRKIVKG